MQYIKKKELLLETIEWDHFYLKNNTIVSISINKDKNNDKNNDKIEIDDMYSSLLKIKKKDLIQQMSKQDYDSFQTLFEFCSLSFRFFKQYKIKCPEKIYHSYFEYSNNNKNNNNNNKNNNNHTIETIKQYLDIINNERYMKTYIENKLNISKDLVLDLDIINNISQNIGVDKNIQIVLGMCEGLLDDDIYEGKYNIEYSEYRYQVIKSYIYLFNVLNNHNKNNLINFEQKINNQSDFYNYKNKIIYALNIFYKHIYDNIVNITIKNNFSIIIESEVKLLKSLKYNAYNQEICNDAIVSNIPVDNVNDDEVIDENADPDMNDNVEYREDEN